METVTSPLPPQVRSGLRLRTIMLTAAAFALAVTLLTLGGVFRQQTLQSIEKEEGNKLAAEAKYFAELLDLTIGQQLMDLRSRAAMLPQLGLHRTPQRLTPWLTSIQRHFSDYTWIGFADPNGMVVSGTAGMLHGKNVAAREWFVRGRIQPSTVDLHPALLLESSLPQRSDGPWRFIDLSSPVHNEEGHLLGVLGAHLSWDWLVRHHQRFSESLLRNRHADIVVVGEDGLTRLTGPASRTMSLGDLESFQRARSGESGWIRERWPEGHTFVVGYTRNPGYGEHHQLGWITLIRLPLEHIHELAKPSLWTVWSALFIAILILAGAWIVLLKLAIKPIEAFASQARLVAQQGGRMQVTSRMSKELQLLAQATNEMLDALRTREASEQAKVRLIADVGHEVRNPMQAVIGYARLLQQRLTAPQDKHDIEQLIHSAMAATDVTNDTLDISANQAGALKLAPQPCELGRLLSSAVEMMQPLAQEKGIALSCVLELDDSLVVLIDGKRLRQVMLNLLSNAIKFTDHGNVTLHARAVMQPGHARSAVEHHVTLPPEMVHLAMDVSDTGAGMSPEQQRRVFERWHQAVEHGAAHADGRGLGLAVSLAIMQSMGGSMELASAPGQGTSVRLKLACARIDTNAALPAPSPSVTHSSKPSQACDSLQKTLRILLVDDMQANREVLRRWLQAHGHEVHEAPNGSLALALANDVAFDVILLDIDLPDIRGWEVARAIRQSGKASCKAMICALSGHGFDTDAQASRHAGMDRHLVKPLDMDQLSQLLREAHTRSEPDVQ